MRSPFHTTFGNTDTIICLFCCLKNIEVDFVNELQVGSIKRLSVDSTVSIHTYYDTYYAAIMWCHWNHSDNITDLKKNVRLQLK